MTALSSRDRERQQFRLECRGKREEKTILPPRDFFLHLSNISVLAMWPWHFRKLPQIFLVSNGILRWSFLYPVIQEQKSAEIGWVENVYKATEQTSLSPLWLLLLGCGGRQWFSAANLLVHAPSSVSRSTFLLASLETDANRLPACVVIDLCGLPHEVTERVEQTYFSLLRLPSCLVFLLGLPKEENKNKS